LKPLTTLFASAVTVSVIGGAAIAAHAEIVPRPGVFDTRIRTVEYVPDDVIVLTGFVGYQIHFEFAPGEEFVNLGTGDRDGIDVGKEGHHLFIKPKVEKVGTNITLLTNRRAYHLHYTAVRKRPDPKKDDVIYSIRFAYPVEEAREALARKEREEAQARARAEREARERALAQASGTRTRNEAYEFCGTGTLRPTAAFDDGVHTRFRFAARTELPAIFLRNDDGTESLVNLNVENDEVVLHRVARQWVLRRGQLVGCVRNAAFEGGGERLATGTVHPAVERAVRRPDGDAGADRTAR
jgi:type IV secretion system protein VirB9